MVVVSSRYINGAVLVKQKVELFSKNVFIKLHILQFVFDLQFLISHLSDLSLGLYKHACFNIQFRKKLHLFMDGLHVLVRESLDGSMVLHHLVLELGNLIK